MDKEKTRKMSTLSLINLKKYYNSGKRVVKALDGISLNVKKGDFIAIKGPSGAGKTTLLNIMGCLDKPTYGEVKINDINVLRLSENELAEIRNKYIGFVFQSFNLIEKLNALENVILPMMFAGIPYDERARKAENLLRKVGLEKRMHHSPSQLSGGEMQRVAIARALANDPKILLVDEPTGNLDSKTGYQIMNILKELNRRDRTIVLVTHDDNIASYAHSIYHMIDGKISKVEDNKK